MVAKRFRDSSTSREDKGIDTRPANKPRMPRLVLLRNANLPTEPAHDVVERVALAAHVEQSTEIILR